MKFELEESLRGASNEELLDDLGHSAKAIGRNTITMAQHEEVGKTHPSTMQRRFGSWPDALRLAGLQPGRSKIGSSNEDDNLESKCQQCNLGKGNAFSV
jgi:hypothetical protein